MAASRLDPKRMREPTQGELNLVVYLTYWMMHAMFVHNNNIYKEKRMECLKEWNKENFKRIEKKAMASYNMVKFLEQKGVDKPIYF